MSPRTRAKPDFSDELMARYDQLIASVSGVERKGASMPYTSVNGNMFSFMDGTGRLSLRLPAGEREAFQEKYGTALSVQHGAVMKEYVLVPDELLQRTFELAKYFELSHTYASSLKGKRKA